MYANKTWDEVYVEKAPHGKFDTTQVAFHDNVLMTAGNDGCVNFFSK